MALRGHSRTGEAPPRPIIEKFARGHRKTVARARPARTTFSASIRSPEVSRTSNSLPEDTMFSAISASVWIAPPAPVKGSMTGASLPAFYLCCRLAVQGDLQQDRYRETTGKNSERRHSRSVVTPLLQVHLCTRISESALIT